MTPLQALDLLEEGGLKTGPQWEAAHNACQGHEGEADWDWIHALCHVIEGDHGNAAYWYRRAGRKSSSADIGEEWAAMRSVLAG